MTKIEGCLWKVVALLFVLSIITGIIGYRACRSIEAPVKAEVIDNRMELPVLLTSKDVTVHGTIMLDTYDWVTVVGQDMNVWRVHINAEIQTATN